jgi:hypothetical protein
MVRNIVLWVQLNSWAACKKSYSLPACWVRPFIPVCISGFLFLEGMKQVSHTNPFFLRAQETNSLAHKVTGHWLGVTCKRIFLVPSSGMRNNFLSNPWPYLFMAGVFFWPAESLSQDKYLILFERSPSKLVENPALGFSVDLKVKPWFDVSWWVVLEYLVLLSALSPFKNECSKWAYRCPKQFGFKGRINFLFILKSSS